MPQIDIRAVLIQNLNPTQFQQITQLATKPFAAASMGQVYKAQITFSSEEKPIPVVFKVLYPGLKNSVRSDVTLLKSAMWAFCKMTGRQMNLDPLFAEIESVLNNEMDYEHEKIANQKFYTLTQNKAWPYMKVKTPSIVADFCSTNFLCMTYESGVPLKNWMDTHRLENEREQLALTLLDLFVTEFFEWGYVQTDPNPANFILQNNSLVALDFGAAKYYDNTFREKYRNLLKTIKSSDEAAIIKEAISFKLIDTRESKETFTLFTELLKLGFQPFLKNSTFNLSDDDFLKESTRLSKLLITQLKYSAPPHQLLFLHRKLAGIYAILRKLKVKIDINQFRSRIDQVDIRN